MDNHRDDVRPARATQERGCFACVHRTGDTPMRCDLFKTFEGVPMTAHEARADERRCGAEGLRWRASVNGLTSNIILFPGERRMAWPKAGSFDGGSAA